MNFRIGLLAEHRGKGIGTEATILALDHAFTMLELHRVSLEVLTFQPAGAAVLREAGFTVEGRLREVLH